MRELPEVTLACVDTRTVPLALRALELCSERLRFASTKLLTDAVPAGVRVPAGIEVVRIAPIASRDAYSAFVLKQLRPYVDTTHVLLVQWDGYVVNADAWDDAFLDVDYLGARWFWHTDGRDVGNGGFSLRSRRLLAALEDRRIALAGQEDETIGREYRPLLEREHGIRFGDAALADRFAFEASYPVGRPFGFHGLYNFCRVVAPAELAALVQSLPEPVLRSPQLAQLMRNCVALAQWQPAIAIARRLLALDAGDAQAANVLAQSEAALERGVGIGRNDPCPCGSGRRYKQCHGAVAPHAGGPSANALVARGLGAHQRGDVEAATRDYRSALATAADHPYALHYLGVIAYQRNRAADALPLLERSASAVPQEPEFHNNLGIVLAALDRPADAVEALRRTIALAPAHAGAWNNLGLALHAQNRLAEAIDAFRRAIALEPELAQLRFNLSLALLADGRFAEGWDAYEARLSIPAFAPASTPSTPRWDGRDADGRTILLVAEQGLGDAIHFARLAPRLASRGARVVLQCPPSLVPLLSTIDGIDDVVSNEAPPPPHDAWLPLLSLARVLAIDAASIPSRVPYLRADDALRRDVAAALACPPGTTRIGIAWTGNRVNTNDRRRSLPLETLAPLFDIPGTRWYSLQKGDDADPANRPDDLGRLVRLPWRESFDGIAAMAMELDAVVTVDTSVAHVAGALARPVYLLLPFMSDWRWRVGRADSDWYPTATLVRQPAPGDWTAAIDTLRSLLQTRDPASG